MIVISHPWEFVPKGSSHLNYHTNSITNKAIIDSRAAASNIAGGAEVQDDTEGQRHQPKAVQALRKNIKLELNNSSLTDYSFVYLNQQKNSLPFSIGSGHVEATYVEKWHLKQINEFCENEIFIKENKVILSYGGDNDSKIIKRSFTFDTPIFDVIYSHFIFFAV